MKRNITLPFLGALALFVCQPLLQAQDEARKQEIIAAVGEDAGNALLSTHQAVNSLASRWETKAIEANEAIELAESYRGSAELCARLVQGKSAALEEAAAALVKQAVALEAWIKIGEASLAEIHAKLKQETDGLISGGGAIDGEGTIELRAVKSVGPDGKPGPLGIMKVKRTSAELPIEVTWTYPNGGGDRGLCVPFPGTQKMAVFFGQGVKTVAIYQRDGTKVMGRWVKNSPGATIGEIALNQGASKAEFDIVGGGKMLLDLREDMTANATWQFEQGAINGIAVGDNEYLALISMEPGAKAGVALYTMSADGRTASGRWTAAGVNGAGEDELVIENVTGVFAGKPAADEGVSLADEVQAIAAKLRLNLGNASDFKPTTEQIAAITGTPEDAAKLTAYTEAIYVELKPGQSAAKQEQTVIKVTGPDLKDLAGGYSQQLAHFRPGVEIYGFKYLAPGEEFGMSFDGLFRVNGKWVFIPKAWRAFAK